MFLSVSIRVHFRLGFFLFFIDLMCGKTMVIHNCKCYAWQNISLIVSTNFAYTGRNCVREILHIGHIEKWKIKHMIYYILQDPSCINIAFFAKMHVWLEIVNSETGTCIRFCDLHICFSLCHCCSDISIKLHLCIQYYVYTQVHLKM